MKPVNDPLLRWRQPVPQEKAWIAEIWGADERQINSPAKGSIFRYLGIFLIIVGIVSALRDGGDIAGAVVTLAVAVVFIFLSSKFSYVHRLHKHRIAAFEQGSYLVAGAYSSAIQMGQNKGFRTGRVRVRLPSGGYLEGLRMPYACAEPLIRQNVHTVPLLLIQIPGDEEILTIPVRQ